MKKNNIKWQKDVFLANAKDIATSAETYVIFACVILLWRFIIGMKFELQSIDPFSTPTFFERSFYSAISFFTTGRILYELRFYKILYEIVVKKFNDWKLYIAIKSFIWLILIFISYQYLVPWAFNFLNGSVSVLFNMANFILYLIPPLGITIILSIIYFIYKPQQTVVNANSDDEKPK